MRILFMSAWYPDPPNNGSKLRIYNLLRGLSKEHNVSLLAFSGQDPGIRSTKLNALCSEVHVIPKRSFNPLSVRATLGFFGSRPRAIADTYAPDMALQIHRQIESNPPDLLLASQWQMAAYWQSFGSVPAIFEEAEAGIFEAKIEAARTPLHRLRHRLSILKLRYYSRDLLPRFRVCTVVSTVEEMRLRRLAPQYHAIEVIPNGVDLAAYRDVCGAPVSNTLVFTGSLRYFANYDAMVWFLDRVFPKIKTRVPDARLVIVGDHANRALPLDDDIILTGLVDDIRPLVASSSVSIAPIRLGGGTRLKILEAMALRSPVVATSIGAEGLDAEHDEHLLIADTPEAYAEAVIRVLGDARLRRRLSSNAHQLVRENYDWPVILPRFLSLLERAASNQMIGTSPLPQLATTPNQP
ncbi:MAG: glycosyltransferase [Anaerolineales bacterium]